MLRTPPTDSRPAGRPVHAAGIEFYHAFFVRKAAKTYRIVIGIVLWPLHNLDGCIQGISATFEKCIGGFDISEAVIGADDDGPLPGIIVGSVSLLARICRRFWNCSIGRHSGRNGSQH